MKKRSGAAPACALRVLLLSAYAYCVVAVGLQQCVLGSRLCSLTGSSKPRMSSGSNHGSFLVSVTDADRLRNIYRMALGEVVKSRRIWENRLPGVVPPSPAVGHELSSGANAHDIREAVRQLKADWVAERAAWRSLLVGRQGEHRTAAPTLVLRKRPLPQASATETPHSKRCCRSATPPAAIKRHCREGPDGANGAARPQRPQEAGAVVPATMPTARPNMLKAHCCPRGGAVFHGKYARFAVLRGCLDQATLEWLRRDPDFPTGPDELKTRYKLQKASEKAKSYTNEYKVQVMGHTGGRTLPPSRSRDVDSSTRCNGLDATVPAPRRTRQWVRAFKRANELALDALQSYLAEALGKLSPAEMGENGKRLRDVHPARWLFHFWMPQPMRPGAGRTDKKHVDGGASIIHLSLSLFGTRKLLFWEEGNDQPHVLILQAGDVYISSPVANEHQVLHDDDPASGEELLEFGGMGPVKLAIQLRCDTFALNRGRSPPASPKAALEAASKAVLRWLLEIPLALPTLEEAQAELV